MPPFAVLLQVRGGRRPPATGSSSRSTRSRSLAIGANRRGDRVDQLRHALASAASVAMAYVGLLAAVIALALADVGPPFSRGTRRSRGPSIRLAGRPCGSAGRAATRGSPVERVRVEAARQEAFGVVGGLLATGLACRRARPRGRRRRGSRALSGRRPCRVFLPSSRARPLAADARDCSERSAAWRAQRRHLCGRRRASPPARWRSPSPASRNSEGSRELGVLGGRVTLLALSLVGGLLALIPLAAPRRPPLSSAARLDA